MYSVWRGCAGLVVAFIVTGVMALKRVVLQLSAPKRAHFIRASIFSIICNNNRTGITIDYTGCKRSTCFIAGLPGRRVNRSTIGSLHRFNIGASFVTHNNGHINVCCLRANTSVHPDGIVCSHTKSSVTRTSPRSFSFSTVVRNTS